MKLNSRGVLMGMTLVASLVFFALVAAWPDINLISVLKGLGILALAIGLGSLLAVAVYSLWVLDNQGRLARRGHSAINKENSHGR